MRHTRARAHAVPLLLFLCVLLLIIAGAASLATAQTEGRRGSNSTAARHNAPDITFTVAMPQPHTHLFEVEMRVSFAVAPSPAQFNLVMPVWTPGSYLVREYARHVQDFAAKDDSGRTLSWRKANKNTWRVETNGARDLVATYRVYANELTVRTNELNDRHAFWNNAALLMYVEGALRAPATLRVVPFKESWKIATGLPAVAAPSGGERNTFRAENFDVLYDSPFLVGDFKTLSFEVRGVPHRIVIDGEGNYDAEGMRRDVQKIVETATAMMKDVPYRDYTFQLLLHPTSRGGLEHLNSTALIWRRFGFRPTTDYRDFLSLVAHEYFHLWNVKRIRPDALGPFDYTGENYTRLLWVAEGITSYYENILVRRAGLMTDKDYLGIIAKAFQDLQNTPGRREMSVEEASFDAWIKYYRPDENTVNSSVSYYDKGAIVGLLLDLEIRKRSGGARSLDDVMRRLYTEYAQASRNYTPEDFQRVAEGVAGASLDEFFRRYVSGSEELDYNAALVAAGLRLDTGGGSGGTSSPTTKAAGGIVNQKAFLGGTLAQDGDRLVIRNVPADTPAYEQGLNANDQIVAVDGIRATLAFLNARLEEKRPGDTIKLTIFRFDELRSFNIKLGDRADGTYRIIAVKEPSAGQRKVYQDWLGAPFPQATGERAAADHPR